MTPIHHMTADELREVIAAVPACEYTAKAVDAHTAEVHADDANRTLATHLRPEVARLFALSRAAVEEVLTLRDVLAKRLAPLNKDVSEMLDECVCRTLAGEDMTLNIDETRVVFAEVERLRTTIAHMAVERSDSDARWARALAEEQERTRIATTTATPAEKPPIIPPQFALRLSPYVVIHAEENSDGTVSLARTALGERKFDASVPSANVRATVISLLLSVLRDARRSGHEDAEATIDAINKTDVLFDALWPEVSR